MLALDSERWSELTTFFGKPTDLPVVLKEWLAAIGFDEEQTIYGRDLVDLFLHQATITNAAFAVVPWLVHVCEEGKTQLQIDYLTHVALVEANRLAHGVQGKQSGTEQYPDWLMDDYKLAITRAQELAEAALKDEPHKERKSGLAAMKPALYGDAELAWKQW